MANETPSYTPAQLQEAEKLVNNFLEGRNDQLGDSRDAALTLAAAMRGEGDPAAKVFRVGNVKNGMVESISYELIYALEQRETDYYGRKATVGVDRNSSKTADQTQTDLHASFLQSMYEPELSLMESYVEIDIGQRASRNSADQQNFEVLQRIA